MGGVGLLVRHMGYSCNIASRVSITSISLLFITGGILFYFVNEEKGREEAQYLSQKAR
jgi:UMF1 family MFS transporter